MFSLLCSLLAGALLTASTLTAQIGGSGSIQGVVSDPSGAVIPRATVVATNVTTGVKTARQTTEAGYYVLSPLPAGEFTVTISSGGFRTLVQEHVVVDALGVVGLNATLKIGASAEQITVTDTPTALNTVDSSMGETVRNELYTALPLAMANSPRDPTAFVSLMPGISGGGGTYSAGNVLGGQPNSQDVYVEGLALTHPTVEGEVRNISLGLSVEAVDQFQLETSGTAVMYGGQGATNFVVKSGTNQFHGAVYEYFRNTVLDARGFFARTDTPEHQNEFGFNIGGPVVKNRIFFFGNYDGFRYITNSAPTWVSIPTENQRAGNFSQLPVTIYDPRTTGTTSSGVRTRQPFSGNIIPSDRISKISEYFQQWLPDPTNSGLVSNYLGSLPTGFKSNSTTAKVDVNLTDKHQFYALYSRGHRGQATVYRGGGNSIPLPYTDTRLVDEYPTTALARHTYVATNTLVNQIGFGYSRFHVPISNATMDGDYPNKAGLKGLPAGEAASSFPEIAWAGPNAPTGWRGTNSRAYVDTSNTFTLQDNVQWTRGKHSITFGTQIQRMQINEKERFFGSNATWNFSNNQTAGFSGTGTLQTSTGHAYASYLLGYVNSSNIIDDSVVGTGGRYRNYAWWVQDNYKVLPRLTLNLGLRYEIMTPYVEVRDRMSFFDPSQPNPAIGGYPGILVFAGDGTNSCGCRTPVQTYYKNFQPRIGFAYSLNDKTVIRGGYGIMSTHRGAVGGRGGARTGTGLLGYTANVTFTTPDSGISPAYDWNNGVPAYQKAPFFDPTLNTAYATGRTQTGSVTYGDALIGGHPPRYQNWNFGFQRALLPSLTLGVNYVGSNGHYLQGGSRGMWSGQIQPKYLVLGNQLSKTVSPTSLANLTAAQAIIPGLALPYPNYSGAISQMLRPFPQYTGVDDPWGMVGNSNYNSLQVTAERRLSQGLTFNINYTFGKGFDDLGSRSGYWSEKAQTTDSTHILNAVFVYGLPFGKNHRLGGGNAVVRALVSGWQFSGITTYRSGTGFGSIGASCNLPNAGSCYADFNPAFSGAVRINGDYRSTDRMGSDTTAFLDKNAFVSPAAYTYGNTPRTMIYKLHNPSSYNQNVSLRREFRFHERWRLALQADAFNVFNWVNWGAPNIAITNANFGRITGQSNSARVLQFNARIAF